MRNERAIPTARRRRIVAGLAVLAICARGASAAAQERTTPDQVTADYKFEPKGFFAEPVGVTRAALFGDRNLAGGQINNGFYTDFNGMPPGAGWIAGGPGYRRWFSGDRMLMDGSALISVHGYKAARARFERLRLMRSRLTLGAQARWQDYPQVAYFGHGPDTLESNGSEYRLRSGDVVGYATIRPVDWIDIDTTVGWLTTDIGRSAGILKRDRPDTRDAFPQDPVFASGAPQFIHSDVAVTADTRDFPGHPTRGGLVRGVAGHYSDRDSGQFSFTRYEAEVERFQPLANSRVVVALHGWLVASLTGPGQSVPFHLEPSLGGADSLRGYGSYRFQDRNLMLLNAEVRVGVFAHLDAAVFMDAGNVAHQFGDLSLAKRSYGAGVRLHSRRQTFARLDVARGSEGWRFVARLTEPLRLARTARRPAALPFVP